MFDAQALRLRYTNPCLERLSSLPWHDGLAFSCYGVRIGIRVNDPEVMERVEESLPPRSHLIDGPEVDCLYSLVVHRDQDGKRVKRFNMLHADTLCMARSVDEEPVLGMLESMFNLTVAIAARRHVFIHAGVVTWGGCAILLPGRSFSGKTSLVEALVKAGATYYSDEYAVLDSQGRVHPYPRHLSIRARDGVGGGRVPIEALGGKAGTRSAPVKLVVAAAHQANAVWKPRSLSPSECVMALTDNAVAIQIRPRKVLSVLQKVALGATCIQSLRDEADAVAAKILKQADIACAGA